MTIARDIQKSIKASEMKRTQKKRTLIMNHMNNVKRKRGRLLHDVMCKTIGKRKKKKKKKKEKKKQRKKKKEEKKKRKKIIVRKHFLHLIFKINLFFVFFPIFSTHQNNITN